jgi:hypothetical protein
VYSRLAAALLVTMLLLPGRGAAQEWETMSSSRRVSGEQMLRVDLEYGAGTLTVAPGAPGTLYRTSLRYDARAFKPEVDYSSTARTAGRLKLRLNGGTSRNIQSGELDLQVTPDVPVELDLKFGAAEATLDLGGLRIRWLDVQTGASKTVLSVSQPNREQCRSVQLTLGAAKFEANGLGNLNTEKLTVQGGVGEVVLDFTGAWARDMTARVEVGLGSLVIRVPRALGVAIVRQGVLSSFDSEGLTKTGNTYRSEHFDRAARKLTLDLNAAFGSVRVVWVDS